jgi:Ca2+-binding EF-hand superfamily protein
MTNKRIRLHASAVALVITIAGFCFLQLELLAPVATSNERNTSWPFLAIVGFAALANFWILYMHIVTPPHPKFLMLPGRKLSIRAHAIGGGVESILGITAWFTGSATLAVLTGVFALALHVPASYYQTQGTFGMKGINVPGYYFIVTVHAYCAGMLVLTQGNEIVWLERTYIALMAYAYFRIFYIFFLQLKAFLGSQYTVALLMSGAVLMPLIFGSSGLVFVALAIGIYLALYKVVYRPTSEEWNDLFEEKERFSLLDGNLRQQWLQLNVQAKEGASPEELAKAVFDKLDTDKSGELDRVEVENLLNAWGASQKLRESFFYHYGETQKIGFGSFVSTFWQGDRAISKLLDDAPADSSSQAKIVFDHIDVDKTGFLEYAEIEMLLLEWGMDAYEARRYITKFAGSDSKIDLKEFEETMQPIWRFGYQSLREGAIR